MVVKQDQPTLTSASAPLAQQGVEVPLDSFWSISLLRTEAGHLPYGKLNEGVEHVDIGVSVALPETEVQGCAVYLLKVGCSADCVVQHWQVEPVIVVWEFVKGSLETETMSTTMMVTITMMVTMYNLRVIDGN
jgi:hypothetical protein